MRMPTAALALAAAALLAAPAAAADGGRRGHGHGHEWERGWGKHRHYGHRHRHYDHRRGGVTFSYVYRPAPRYLYRAPPEVVIVERPVVVERPIVVAPPPGVALGPEIDDGSGRYCREYRTTGRIGGRLEELWGVACLQPDGSWELAS
jgi:hypothetical protein